MYLIGKWAGFKKGPEMGFGFSAHSLVQIMKPSFETGSTRWAQDSGEITKINYAQGLLDIFERLDLETDGSPILGFLVLGL